MSRMPCFQPLVAYRTANGITFSRNASLSGTELKLPCGRCIGCRLERSRQWATRLMHECKLHEINCFVTLTYANEFLPPGGTLVKRDLQLFMKRLRKVRGSGVRFFACGEYGELNARPHYHAILFNCGFADKLFHGQNSRGDRYYVSRELSGLWPVGNNIVGDVSFDSAAYVARYSLKKVNGPSAAEHYSVVDGDGVVYQREPEFGVMSRRPGIGAGYYEKFGHEVRAHDNVVVNGHECKPPRFYDTRTEERDVALFERIKRARRRRAVLNRLDNTRERLDVKQELVYRRLVQLKRRV